MWFTRKEVASVIGASALLLACAPARRVASGQVAHSRVALSTTGAAWVPQPPLVPNSGVVGDRFGYSVAIDGDVALVGAIGRDRPAMGQGDDPVPDTGSAFVWRRAAGAWSIEQELFASDAVTNQAFGCSVAVSGNTVAVGAGVGGVGAVYIFSLDSVSHKWTESKKLTGTGSESFGYALALRGNQLLIGAPKSSAAGSEAGAAYLATRTDSAWSGASPLPFSPKAGDLLGYAVALGEDLVGVGAPGVSSNAGAAYLLPMPISAAAFPLQTPGVHPVASFGSSISISGTESEANTVAVGAPTYFDPAGDSTGAVFVFAGSGPTWNLSQLLAAAELESGDSFGTNVALDSDVLLSTAPGADLGRGRAYLLLRDQDTWSPIEPFSGEEDYAFGRAGALSGRSVLVGSEGFDNQPGEALIVSPSDGSSCSVGNDCSSGHCSEGVCCDQACNDDCHSCLKKNKPNGGDGKCGVIVAGPDPRGGCKIDPNNNCGNTGSCDALGQCAQQVLGSPCGNGDSCTELNQSTSPMCNGQGTCEPNLTECGDFACSGKACKTRCDSDLDCADGIAYCETNTGICKPRQDLACTSDSSGLRLFNGDIRSCGSYRCGGGACLTRCDTASDCADGFSCSDHVCCNEPCTGECHSCLKSGKASGPDGICGPAKPGDDPRGVCKQGTGDCRETGLCNGAGNCAYIDKGSNCGEPACLTSDTAISSSCDGAGNCIPQTQACDLSLCKGTECVDWCGSDASCADSAYCSVITRHCEQRQPIKCSPHGDAVVSYDGVTQTSCSPFRCDNDTAVCLSQCAVSSDCLAGYCQDGECAAVQLLSEPASSCAFGQGVRATAQWHLTALSLFALIGLSRRRARLKASPVHHSPSSTIGPRKDFEP